MPLYQITCEKHGKQEVFRGKPMVVESAPCPVCGDPCQRDWSAGMGLAPFKSYWTEALSQERNPIEVRSRMQEKQLKQKFGFERVS